MKRTFIGGFGAVALIGALALGDAATGQAQQGRPPTIALPAVGRVQDAAPKPADRPTPGDDQTAAAPDDDTTPDSAGPATSIPNKPAEPMKRPRYAVAIIQALDKVTTETVRFEAPVGHPVRYKSLIFTVSACETTAPDEDQSDAIAHVEIDSQPKIGAQTVAPARQVFRGWMFANAPGLHLFQHPVYDAWLIACKTVSPPA